MKYRLIYADPPWAYDDKTYRGAAVNHYDVCTLPQIGQHIENLADPTGCALAIWQTWPLQDDQDAMLRAFGWKKVTMLFVWVKTTKDGGLAWGVGRYSRANTEPVFVWRRGKDWPRVVAHDVHQVIMSKRQEHSRKPDEARKRLERLFGPVPRIEMYRRGPAPEGWDAWGNEVEAAA